MSKGTNRNLDARSTLEQLSALYTDHESHNAQRHRQTDGRTDRRTDGQQAYANSRSYCVAVRSAKNRKYIIIVVVVVVYYVTIIKAEIKVTVF